MLIQNPKGLYGSEFVHKTNGFFPRGSIYTSLVRLSERGLVSHVIVPASSELNKDRPLYKCTDAGIDAVQKFAEEFGFMLKA